MSPTRDIMSPMNTKPPIPGPSAPVPRERLTFDVPPDVLFLLDYIAGATGMSRNAVVLMIVGNGVVDFIDKARELKARVKDLSRVGK